MKYTKDFWKFVILNMYKGKQSMKNLSEILISDDSRLLLEMARVGDMDNKLAIYIRSNDPRNIPHFHIVDQATLGNEFHTCIKIGVAEYFHHTGKENILNTKQKKSLMKFFSKSDKWGDNYWDIVLQEWNRNNSKIEVDRKLKIPNYLEL